MDDPLPDADLDRAPRRRIGRPVWLILAALAAVILVAIAVMLVGGGHGIPRHVGAGSTAPAVAALAGAA